MKTQRNRIAEIIEKNRDNLVAEWAEDQLSQAGRQKSQIKPAELREQCATFTNLLQEAAQDYQGGPVSGDQWKGVREFLSTLSGSRAQQGFSPGETATFVLSFKRPLFERLRKEFGKDAQGLGDHIWQATELLDRLALHTTEFYQKMREDIIARQQEDMLELSTPVVKLWEGILALPLIGTLDSARTQVVMESLLQKLVETGSNVAIIDITGVPTVDTLVAQHLIKTVTAARLMGAECIISGIRPQIAQTIVHLGVTLTGVVTKANLADAFVMALQRSGLTISNLSRTGSTQQ